VLPLVENEVDSAEVTEVPLLEEKVTGVGGKAGEAFKANEEGDEVVKEGVIVGIEVEEKEGVEDEEANEGSEAATVEEHKTRRPPKRRNGPEKK